MDYATSGSPSDHPNLYTHMPNGPTLLNGFLLFLGAKPVHLRILATLFTSLGLFFFGLFIYSITKIPILAFCSVLALVFGNSVFLLTSDHLIHCYYLLSFFGALWSVQCYLDTSKIRFLFFLTLFVGICSVTSFFAAIAQVSALLCISFCTKNPRRKYILLPLVTFPLYLLLHFFTNAFSLGSEVASKEILLTLQNRLFGYPPRSVLEQYFTEHNLVLWGAETLTRSASFSDFLIVLKVYLPAGLMILLMFLFFRKLKEPLKITSLKKSLMYLFATVFGVDLVWNLFFPAHAQNYSIPLTQMVSPIIALCFLLPHGLELFKHVKPLWRPDLRGTFLKRFLLLLLLILILYNSLLFLVVLSFRAKKTSEFLPMIFKGKGTFYDLLETITLPTSEGVWTNMMSVVLYSRFDNPIYGPCTIRALVSKDVQDCNFVFIHNWHQRKKEENRPRYYVLGKKLALQTLWSNCLTGSSCYSETAQFLETHFRKIGENSSFAIYDINYFRSPQQSQR